MWHFESPQRKNISREYKSNLISTEQPYPSFQPTPTILHIFELAHHRPK